MKKLPKIIKKRGRQLLTPREPEPTVNPTAAPRITSDNVTEHRAQVLGSARKYIYPLQHSKHRIVVITSGIILAAIVLFFSYTALALYRLQSTSTFMYRVTQVLPFPVARSGGQLIAYENYLFELRHYMHYYETQAQLDFSSTAGKEQLAEYKRRALEKVINDAYVKKLADQNDITVSNAEVDAQIDVARSQNRLGEGGKVFEDILKDYWGWSVDDFRRSLRQQLLAQKVVAHLDQDTQARAAAALKKLEKGADFEDVAKRYSEDGGTKDDGGAFSSSIARTNRDLSPLTTDALFKLKAGKHSGIINIGYSLEIVKTLENNGDRVRGAHILFNFKDISKYINDLKEKQPVRLYLKLPKAVE